MNAGTKRQNEFDRSYDMLTKPEQISTVKENLGDLAPDGHVRAFMIKTQGYSYSEVWYTLGVPHSAITEYTQIIPNGTQTTLPLPLQDDALILFEKVGLTVREFNNIADVWERLEVRYQRYHVDDAPRIARHFNHFGTDIVSVENNPVTWRTWFKERDHTTRAELKIGGVTLTLRLSVYCPNAWIVTMELGEQMLVSGYVYGYHYRTMWRKLVEDVSLAFIPQYAE